jgi:hypothetical protein
MGAGVVGSLVDAQHVPGYALRADASPTDATLRRSHEAPSHDR